jgi:hypothetical protein
MRLGRASSSSEKRVSGRTLSSIAKRRAADQAKSPSIEIKMTSIKPGFIVRGPFRQTRKNTRSEHGYRLVIAQVNLARRDFNPGSRA